MVKWPVVIKYIGEDELTYICNQREWSGDPELNSHLYTTGDEIIDSNGRQYSLAYNKDKKIVEILKIHKMITISDFETLIKNHMVSLNQCCSSKIKLASFADGIMLVERTVE